jgi:hypothetical protein
VSPSNPIQIHQFLRGADWPADRQELRTVAVRNAADEMVLEALDALPDGRFGSPAELTAALDPTLPASGAGSGPRGLSSQGDDLESHPSQLNPPE